MAQRHACCAGPDDNDQTEGNIMELKEQVFEVNRANFEELVLRGSQERVIVVDFWAPWCDPCRTLGPVLEEVVRDLGPGIALAKVNVDENQELAMAFRVQSIPAVKIVKDGQLVQEFSGAQPRERIEALLRPLVPVAPVKPEDELRETARNLAAGGDTRRAAQAYEKILADRPDDDGALLELARIRLQQGDTDAVQQLVDRIDETAPEFRAGQALLTLIGFSRICAEYGGRTAAARKILAAPEDMDARYAFACCAAVEGDYETALADWLRIVEQDRDYQDGAAKDAMVAVFHLLGRDNELVASYQRRLYQTLY